MSKTIVTMGPTMCNPEAITDISELRRELHRANDTMFDLSSRVHDLTAIIQSMSIEMSKLFAPYIMGDQEAFQRELAAFAQKHIHVIKDQSGVH